MSERSEKKAVADRISTALLDELILNGATREVHAHLALDLRDARARIQELEEQARWRDAILDPPPPMEEVVILSDEYSETSVAYRNERGEWFYGGRAVPLDVLEFRFWCLLPLLPEDKQ